LPTASPEKVYPPGASGASSAGIVSRSFGLLLQVGRLLDQAGRHLRIGNRLGVLEQGCSLPIEILSSRHVFTTHDQPSPARQGKYISCDSFLEMYKSEHFVRTRRTIPCGECWQLRGGHQTSMRNPVRPDDVPGRAVAAEIGERLRQIMGVDTDLPPPLQSLLDRLRASGDQSSLRQ
jgi:hypothetical protein